MVKECVHYSTKSSRTTAVFPIPHFIEKCDPLIVRTLMSITSVLIYNHFLRGKYIVILYMKTRYIDLFGNVLRVARYISIIYAEANDMEESIARAI